MRRYEFALLQYFNEYVSGERVSVAVVMWQPEAQALTVQASENYGRLSKFFHPDFDGSSYRQLIRSVTDQIDDVHLRIQQGDLLHEHPEKLAGLLPLALDDIDGCLKWSTILSGIAEDPDIRLRELYEEFIGRHDAGSERSRRDEEVIRRSLDAKLAARGLANDLTKDVLIRGQDYEYKFHSGWVNGLRQVLEPVSLDYLKASDVVEKATSWSGKLFNLQTAEPFKMTCVVAPPSDPNLAGSVQRAIAILQRSPSMRKVVMEDEMDVVFDQIEADLQH